MTTRREVLAGGAALAGAMAIGVLAMAEPITKLGWPWPLESATPSIPIHLVWSQTGSPMDGGHQDFSDRIKELAEKVSADKIVVSATALTVLQSAQCVEGAARRFVRNADYGTYVDGEPKHIGKFCETSIFCDPYLGDNPAVTMSRNGVAVATVALDMDSVTFL